MHEVAVGRVAPIYDIHGNIAVLEAVLTDIASSKVDRS